MSETIVLNWGYWLEIIHHIDSTVSLKLRGPNIPDDFDWVYRPRFFWDSSIYWPFDEFANAIPIAIKMATKHKFQHDKIKEQQETLRTMSNEINNLIKKLEKTT